MTGPATTGPATTESPDVTSARKLLAAAATAIAVGLGVAGTVSQVAGGVILLAGWLTLVYGLHRFGRAGSMRKAETKSETAT